MKFGRLTVVSLAPWRKLPSGRRIYRWNCTCECGAQAIVYHDNMVQGKANSCGCLKSIRISERNRKHGLRSHPLYPIWCSMKRRCLNPISKDYADYGGRGITVCERWLGDDGLANFISDVGERPDGKSLDRENNNGNYEPNNVRWATAFEQSNNSRHNRWITIDGISKTLTQWANSTGMPVPTLFNRLNILIPKDAINPEIPASKGTRLVRVETLPARK